MTDLVKEYQKCRERWLKAARQKDKPMMDLWERVGKKLRTQLPEGELDQVIKTAKKIFK